MIINPELENDFELVKIRLREIKRISASGAVDHAVSEAMRKLDNIQRKLRNEEYGWRG